MVIKCTLILKPMNTKWLKWENLMGKKYKCPEKCA
jgi:hypothetical protein